VEQQFKIATKLASNDSALLCETNEGSQPLRNEQNFLDYIIVLARQKRMIFKITMVPTIVAVVGTVLWPNSYTATAKLIIPQQNQSSSALLLGQLGSLAGLAGGGLGVKNPGDMYVGMLKSRTVADPLVQRFNLKEVYGKKTLDEARAELDEHSQIILGKDNIIAISVEDEGKKRAAELANAYVEELNNVTKNMAITEASQRRLFFEEQVKKAKNDLAESEVALKQSQIQTGLIQLDGQAKAIIEAVAKMRAELVSAEIRLQSIRSFATEENPEVIQAKKTITELRAQLARMEGNQKTGNGSVILSTGEVPGAGLEYVRRLRDVKYNETIFELLAKQFELAKIDESKDLPILQVLEVAAPPEKKSGPPRTRMVLMTFASALFLSCLWVFLLNELENINADAHGRARLELLRHLARLRN
jgi:uncharacterized protein involved in exopolysaccharide biosynthesis